MAVCIVTYRNAGDLLRCLEALGASDYPDFSVVVCENGGPEAFQQLQAAAPARLSGGQAVSLILAEDNLGYAGGVNRCMAASPEADAWWVLNPDTAPEPSALGALVRRLRKADCQAAGNVVCFPDGRIQSFGGRWRPLLARAVSLGYGAPVEAGVDTAAIERSQNYLNGASMMVTRRFLEAVGPMREDYFLYCEEVEWCLRALGRGMVLGFAADSRVIHEQGTTTGNVASSKSRSDLSVYLNERNRMLLTRDCFPGRLLVAAPAAVALAALRYLRRGAWRQFGVAVAGLLAGLRNERGRPATSPAA